MSFESNVNKMKRRIAPGLWEHPDAKIIERERPT